MKKGILLLLFLLCITAMAAAQIDTGANANFSDVYERITKQVAIYRPDTSMAPNDKITRKILELRALRGGFNINEAVAFMIQDERQKGEKPKAQLDQLAAHFTLGKGRRWLNNAAIWIYRNHFTYKELKQLVKFYKTSAGKKMAVDFPVIVLKSMAAAEMLKINFEEKNGF